MPIHIPLEQSYGTGSWEGTEDLMIRPHLGARSIPHVVHYFDETASVRRVPGGPMEPGPYAYLIPRIIVPDPAPKTHRIKADDRVEIAGHIYAIRVTDQPVDPELQLMSSPVGASH